MQFCDLLCLFVAQNESSRSHHHLRLPDRDRSVRHLVWPQAEDHHAITSSAIVPCHGGQSRFRSSPLKPRRSPSSRFPESLLRAAETSSFLQLVFGYLLGRIVISLLFIPSYFRGELLTVYQLLDQRFGGKIKMLAASLFVVMRNIADGIRLLLTAIVLAAVYTAFQPAANAETIIIGSIILIGLAMIIFTYFGGMEAVIWVEVVQLGIYIAGAIAAAVVLITSIDGGLATVKLVGNSVWQVFAVRFHFRPHTDLHVLVRIDRRLFPDDEHARHRSISRAALSLHRSPASRDRCAADERRHRVGAVHRFSFYRSVAVCVLSSVYRSRLCDRRIDSVSVYRRRPRLSRLHHEAHADRTFGSGGGGDLCGGDVVVAQLDRRDSGERSLQAVSSRRAMTSII